MIYIKPLSNDEFFNVISSSTVYVFSCWKTFTPTGWEFFCYVYCEAQWCTGFIQEIDIKAEDTNLSRDYVDLLKFPSDESIL